MMGTKVFNNALDMISFSRASGGTALRKISYGSEIFPNGNFDDGATGWALSAQSVVANGVGNVISTDGSYQYIADSLAVTAGKVYLLAFDLVERSSGTPRVSLTGAASGTYSISASLGDKQIAFVAASTGSVNIYFDRAGGVTDYKFDNASLKEVLFDRPDGTLTLFNHPTNIPRIEYDASGAVKGLLVEEARTNLLTYSGDFTNAVWSTKVNEVTGITDPAGGSTAITVSASSDNQIVLRHSNLSIASTAAVHTNSLYVKRRSGTGTLRLSDPSNVAIDVTSQLVLGEWVKVSASNVVYLGTTVYFILTAGTAGDEFDVAFGQTEAGAFPTSYIPTSGATATRAADIASIPVSAFGYNQKAGSVVVEWQTIGGLSDSTAQYLLGTANSSARWAYHNSPGIMQTWDGSNARNIVTSAADLTSYTSGVSTNQSLITTATNGTNVIIDAATTGNLASLTAEFRLGADHISANQLNGHIRSIAYYPRRLSNAQLIEVTS